MVLILSYGPGELDALFGFLLILLTIFVVVSIIGLIGLINSKFGCWSAISLASPIAAVPLILWEQFSFPLVFMALVAACVALFVLKVKASPTAKQVAKYLLIGIVVAVLSSAILLPLNPLK